MMQERDGLRRATEGDGRDCDAGSGSRQMTPWRIAPVSQRLAAGLVDGTVLALVGLSAWGSFVGIDSSSGVGSRA
jgi:hypothetical protein